MLGERKRATTCDRIERSDLLGQLGERMDPHVDACPDCRARRDGYARLTAALARESGRPLPDGWKQQTLARVQARAARPKKRAVSVGLSLAIAAAAILVSLIQRDRSGPAGANLVVRVDRRRSRWRGPWPSRPGAAHRGDVLHVTASGLAGPFELRVYRDGRHVVARCTGAAEAVAPKADAADARGPRCRRTAGGVELSWALPVVGAYQAVWMTSPSPLPPSGQLAADLRAARAAGAIVAESEPIDVD